MLIAVDSYNNRIAASKGTNGYCQLCKNEVRAYCGEINIHHWRHVNSSACDLWKENESEWHRDWKNNFPKEWQEVIIKDNFEKHIADIKTPNGLVLELQNSSISSNTIQIRERFYNNIFWLINAEGFKDNFSIRSCVTSKLRYIDEGYRSIHLSIENSSHLENLIKEYENIEIQIEKLDYSVINSIRSIEKVEDYHKISSDEALRMLNMSFYYSFGVIEGFKPSKKEQFDSIAPAVKIKEDQIKSRQDFLNRIMSYPLCKLEGFTEYRMVPLENVNQSAYSKCIMIERDSADSLFPTVLTFKSEWEFQQRAKNKLYDFYIDPSNKLDTLTVEINNLKRENTELENARDQILKDTTAELKDFLEAKKVDLQEGIRDFDTEILNLKASLLEQQQLIDSTRKEENIQHEKELKQYEFDRQKERTAAMKKYKGLYTYHWKHRRKSWDFSERKIFLDFENHIFEKVEEDLFRKLSYLDFIQKVKEWIPTS